MNNEERGRKQTAKLHLKREDSNVLVASGCPSERVREPFILAEIFRIHIKWGKLVNNNDRCLFSIPIERWEAAIHWLIFLDVCG